MPTEILDETVARLLKQAAGIGREVHGNDTSADLNSGEADMSGFPDITTLLSARLRRVLEDEIVPAPLAAEGGGIAEDELDREVAKKALVGLKVATLRQMARDRGLAVSGPAEEMAERVARALEWDEEAIARLVLANESEPRADRGHVTRIFPLEASTSLEGGISGAHARLREVAGRYVRVGVARWFVFDQVESVVDDGELTQVEGSYKSYDASVEQRTGEPSLQAVPASARASLTLAGDNSLRVDGVSLRAARAAALAFRYATGVETRGYVPYGDQRAAAKTGSVHPSSMFILDMLASRLRTFGFLRLTPEAVRFRVSDGGGEVGGDGQDEGVLTRPALRAVKLEGRHLLDSVQACRLLAVDGRPLIDVTLRASLQVDGVTATSPIRLTLDNDHVLVATGFGTAPELSLEVHRRVVDVAVKEIRDGWLDEAALEELVTRITTRAGEDRDPDAATVLADEV